MTEQYERIGIIIPARYESTRLPGKPLIDLEGKSMINRTWERCVEALSPEKVFIATDNELIKTHCLGFGAQVVMTSDNCLTGTDRIAEANEILNLDLIINVQGDEPIIDPVEICHVINFAIDNPGCIVNAVALIDDDNEYRSVTIPKVAMTPKKKLLYMSRSPIPGSKSEEFTYAYKQICIYAFPKQAIQLFRSHPEKTPLESVEDIEILRFLELGLDVHLVEVSGKSMAVDVPSDVTKAREIIKNIDKVMISS